MTRRIEERERKNNFYFFFFFFNPEEAYRKLHCTLSPLAARIIKKKSLLFFFGGNDCRHLVFFSRCDVLDGHWKKGNVDELVIGFDKKRVQIIITQAYAMTFDVSTRSFSIPARDKSMCAAANELRSFVRLIRMRSASIG